MTLTEQIQDRKQAELAAIRSEAREILGRFDKPQAGDAERIAAIYQMIGRELYEIDDDAKALEERLKLGHYIETFNEAEEARGDRLRKIFDRLPQIQKERDAVNARLDKEAADLENAKRQNWHEGKENEKVLDRGRALDAKLAAVFGPQEPEYTEREIERYNARLRSENEGREKMMAEEEANKVAGGVYRQRAKYEKRLREDREHAEHVAWVNRGTLGKLADQ